MKIWYYLSVQGMIKEEIRCFWCASTRRLPKPAIRSTV